VNASAYSSLAKACLVLAAAAAVPAIPAAEDILIDNYTDPAAVAGTARWWGNAVQTYEHDATQDADGDAASGALKVTVQYDIAAYAGENQFSARRQILPSAVIDGSQYARLEFDLKYAASSVAQGTSGTYGNLEVGIGHNDWSQAYFGTVQTPVGQNDWQHIVLTVNQNNPKLNQLRDFHFKQWSGGAGDGMTGTQMFWIDNVKLIAIPSTEPPPPPPIVTVEPAKPGLNMISSGGGQYDRQTVRSSLPEYTWVGATGPVTYALTIADYPSQAGYQTVIYLVPGSGLDAGMNYPDWAQAKCALAFINNNADGSGNMRFAYKNDVANSNGYAGHGYWDNDNPADLYDGITGAGPVGTGKGGTLAYVNSTTIRGTWSITFTSNTNVTITAPDGQTSSGSLPNETTAQLFGGPLYAYFGTVPQTTDNVGLGAVFSRIKITGAGAPLDEDFSTIPFNPALEKSASNASGVVQVTGPDTPFWLTWTLPAVGYLPRQSPSLGEDVLSPWTNIPTDNVLTARGRQWKLMETAQLLDPSRNFFQLIKPAVAP
jgi:hypothetical protein